MNIKKTIILILVLLAALLAGLYFLNKEKNVEENQDAKKEEAKNILVYIDKNSGEPMQVSFTENTATIYVDEYSTIDFTATTSASGAKYENADGFVLWNKGDEVSLYLNDSVFFEGVLKKEGEEIKVESFDKNLIGVWYWIETKKSDNTIVKPKEAGNFAIAISEDANVSGVTDCNNFNAKVETINNQIAFKSMMSTLMACPDSQEGEFTSFIQDSESYEINSEGKLVLKLKDGAGEVLFEKE